MTVNLFHPEALLDRELEAQLTPEESERLQRHLGECEACELERALRQSVQLPLTHDEERLAERAADRAAELFLVPDALRKPASTRILRWGVLAASLALAAVGFAAVGGWLALRTRHPQSPPAAPMAGAASPGAAPPGSVPGGSSAVPVLPESAVISGVQAPVLTPLPSAPMSIERAAEGPGELFARANRARRQDQTQGAAALYRELQARFPKSHEALVSCVTLGRLMLDRLNQPSGALTQFERYLDAVPGGGLREEAIIGRALALGRLGRGPEERSAWQALLKEYPDSMYSERARARLAP